MGYGDLTWISYVETLYWFTKNDLTTFVLSTAAFGLLGALAGSALASNSTTSALTVISRAPKTLIWCWIHTLMFNISNQRLSSSILEDEKNKPWRPLPAKRIGEKHARQLLLFMLPVVYLASCLLGAREQSLHIMVLTWMYNDLNAADEDLFVRAIFNALGFTAWHSGAFTIATNMGWDSPNNLARGWIVLIGAVILTTLHVQDLPDQLGDRARNRKTVPLILGDSTARWTVALGTIFWSIVCPSYWGMSWWGFMWPIVFSATVAFRSLMMRGVEADKQTFKMWGLWLICLYSLPFFSVSKV